MKFRHLHYLLTLALLSHSVSIRCERLSIQDGLSHNGVTSIIEDSRGYLWIGTYDGLNKYNGCDYTIFRNTPSSNILCSNHIRSLYEDKLGQIWIGTDRGVMIFDPMRHQFADLSLGAGLYQNQETIINIAHLDDERTIIQTENGGIAIFNLTGTLLSYQRMAEATFNSLVQHSNNIFLITTNSGLAVLNVANNTLKMLEGEIKELCEKICHTPTLNHYAIATRKGAKIIQLVEKNDSISYVVEQTLYEELNLKTLYYDSQSTLWLGTDLHGVTKISTTSDSHSASEKVTSDLRTSCIVEGKNERIWIGTFDKGVELSSRRSNPFLTIELFDGLPYRTLGIMSLDDKNIVIKCNKQHIKYNTQTHTHAPFFPTSYSKYTTTIASSNDGYVMTIDTNKEKKLYKINLKKGTLTQRKKAGADLPLGTPRLIAEDAYDNLWIAYAEKIVRAQLETENNTMIIKSINLPNLSHHTQYIRCIYSDPKDSSLWVATSMDGLYHIQKPNRPIQDLQTKHYTHSVADKKGLTSNFISSITRDTNGVLWIGTEHGGLCRLNEPQMTFDSFTSENSNLANNNIKSIEYDNQNRLWVATNIGLSLFDIEKNHFTNFNTQNGIPDENISYYSAKLGDNTFVFAGSDKAFYFNADKIVLQEALPPFHFGELRLYNQNVVPNQVVDDHILYTSRFTSGDTLTLNHRQNVLSIEVDALHYQDNHNHSIHYKVLPINTDWIINSKKQTNISINGLNPGHYEIRAAISNTFGEWSEEKTLHIIIHPPWWKTWWAYTLYALFAITLTCFAIYSLLKMQRLHYKARMDEMKHENMVEK